MTEIKKRQFIYTLLIVLVLSLGLKIFLMYLFPDRVYPDVQRALDLGSSILSTGEIRNISSKTYFGPILWYIIYQHTGLLGLKILNIAGFILLFVLQYRIGRKFYSPHTLLIAAYLFAFYVGTNLNVVVGEQDDIYSSLFFTAGILCYLYKDTEKSYKGLKPSQGFGKVILASLLMGIGLLFKFSTGIFCLGFEIFLLLTRRWKAFILAGIGILIPFLCMNLFDHFTSFTGLLRAFEIQRHYSSWGQIIFKLFSTGMIFSFVVSIWILLKEKDEKTLLFFLLPTMYLIYVFLMRDAFAMSYIMMQGLFFSSFLIAQFLLRNPYFGPKSKRKVMIYSLLVSYMFITIAITYRNILYDTLNSRY